MTIPEIESETGLNHNQIGTYLTRAIRRGHVYRPERGVYTTEGMDPTNHPHQTCQSCGQPLAASKAARTKKEEK